jgi:hypothetical protein
LKIKEMLEVKNKKKGDMVCCVHVSIVSYPATLITRLLTWCFCRAESLAGRRTLTGAVRGSSTAKRTTLFFRRTVCTMRELVLEEIIHNAVHLSFQSW